jgi:hypothetical protein
MAIPVCRAHAERPATGVEMGGDGAVLPNTLGAGALGAVLNHVARAQVEVGRHFFALSHASGSLAVAAAGGPRKTLHGGGAPGPAPRAPPPLSPARPPAPGPSGAVYRPLTGPPPSEDPGDRLRASARRSGRPVGEAAPGPLVRVIPAARLPQPAYGRMYPVRAPAAVPPHLIPGQRAPPSPGAGPPPLPVAVGAPHQKAPPLPVPARHLQLLDCPHGPIVLPLPVGGQFHRVHRGAHAPPRPADALAPDAARSPEGVFPRRTGRDAPVLALLRGPQYPHALAPVVGYRGRPGRCPP